ncbi:MAG: helicase HerA domain-containing protein [Promethearchaeota archaeon]
MNNDEIGIVTGKTNPYEFFFVINEGKEIAIFDYVMIELREEGESRNVLCQVVDTAASSPAATEKIPAPALDRLRQIGMQRIHRLAKARVIGYLKGNSIIMPKHTVPPMTQVNIASTEILKEFFVVPSSRAIAIGHLLNRREVLATLDATKLNRHLAIMGITGSGKSNAAGVVIEELHDLGATVIVLDPHGDYISIKQSANGQLYSLHERMTIFSEESRNPFTAKFADIPILELYDLARIPETYTHIRRALSDGFRSFKKSRGEEGFTPQELADHLEAMADEGEGTASSAAARVRNLARFPVFGLTNTPLTEILQPQHISVLDLSGLSDAALQMVCLLLVRRIYEARLNYMRNTKGETFNRPVFIFLEEAHKFVPAENRARSSEILRTIAAEGRKFGVFIVLVTQRPSKVQADVLAMCNSQIIFRIINAQDQTTIQNTSEAMAADLLEDLPGLNVGEAIIIGSVAPAPLAVMFRLRKTKHGGADIDIAAEFKAAKREVNENGLIKPEPSEEDVDYIV